MHLKRYDHYLHSTLIKYKEWFYIWFKRTKAIYIPLWLNIKSPTGQKIIFRGYLHSTLIKYKGEEAFNENVLEKQIYIPLWLNIKKTSTPFQICLNV